MSNLQVSGSVAFSWMAANTRPPAPGNYSVLYDIPGRAYRGEAYFTGDRWNMQEPLSEFFTYWLMIAEPPLPMEVEDVQEVAAERAGDPVPGNSLREMYDFSIHENLDELLNDELPEVSDDHMHRLICHLQTHADANFAGILQAVDPEGALPINSAEAIIDARYWICDLIAQVTERGLISVLDGRASLTANGIDVARFGFRNIAAANPM